MSNDYLYWIVFFLGGRRAMKAMGLCGVSSDIVIHINLSNKKATNYCVLYQRYCHYISQDSVNLPYRC